MDSNSSLPSCIYIDRPLPMAGAMVGVGLVRIDEEQNHTGILYRESEKQARFLELQWHHRIQDANPPEECAFVLLRLHPFRAPAVAAYCRFVGERIQNRGIPYGFQLPNNCFDEQGGWRLDRIGQGLTCATFVLAVFEAQRLSIVKLDDWQPRDSDLAWKAKVISALKQRAPEQACYLEKNELECVRYRPEEVAGAAATESYPARFEVAEALGKRILNALCARGPH